MKKVILRSTLMQSTIHAYEVRPRKDNCGVDLISDVLPSGRLSAFHPHAQGNAFPRGERQQSRSFALQGRLLKRSPSSNPLC
jgi:hypothetical protein